LTGIAADLLGVNFSISLIGALTAISGLVVLVRMQPAAKRTDNGEI
jgi:hypothetical protein